MTFAWPHLFWLVVVLALSYAVVFAVDLTRRKRDFERIGTPSTLGKMTVTASGRRRVLRYALWAVGLTLASTAFLRPQVPGKATWVPRGIDVVLVVDYSKSMLASDVYPNRLDLAKRHAAALVGDLQADRVGIVQFAGGRAGFPLTHDHQVVRAMLDAVASADLPAGTDLGLALRSAGCTLGVYSASDCSSLPRGTVARAEAGPPLQPLGHRESPSADRSAAAVVFTDGGDNMDPAKEELQRLVSAGIEVFFVAVGTTHGELIPDFNENGTTIGWVQDAGVPVRSRLNDSGIKEIAELAGKDRYFLLDGVSNPRIALLAKLRALKKGTLDERVVNAMEDVYGVFLFPAFLLLAIEGLVSQRRKRR